MPFKPIITGLQTVMTGHAHNTGIPSPPRYPDLVGLSKCQLRAVTLFRSVLQRGLRQELTDNRKGVHVMRGLEPCEDLPSPAEKTLLSFNMNVCLVPKPGFAPACFWIAAVGAEFTGLPSYCQ